MTNGTTKRDYQDDLNTAALSDLLGVPPFVAEEIDGDAEEDEEVTEWYRAGRRGLASGGLVDPSIVTIDDFEQIHITSKLIVAQAYAYGCDRVVYTIKPLDEVAVLDPRTGHGICGMAKIDGIAQAGEDPAALWPAVAKSVWWDGSLMYTDDGYTNPPPGLPDCGVGAQLTTQFQTRKHLLPGQLKMLLESHDHQLAGWSWPMTTWLVG